MPAGAEPLAIPGDANEAELLVLVVILAETVQHTVLRKTCQHSITVKLFPKLSLGITLAINSVSSIKYTTFIRISARVMI